MSNSIRIDTAKLDQIAAHLDINRKQALRALAVEIEAQAKIMAPVDTGALRNSIYTEGNGQSGFSAASSSAQSAHPGISTEAAPSPDDNHAIIVACVDYAAYVELGTSKQGAQPFLGPALEDKVHDLNSGKMGQKLMEEA